MRDKLPVAMAALLVCLAACDEDVIQHGPDAAAADAGVVDDAMVDMPPADQASLDAAPDSGADSQPWPDMTSPDGPGKEAGKSCKRVFISSTSQNGAMGGVTGADTTCQKLATAAKLSGTYRAWVSNATTDPKASFTKSSGLYCLTDGTMVAASWTDLTNGTIAIPINLTESGQKVTGESVWTGTLQNGIKFATKHCSGFTDGTSASSGLVGKVDKINPYWSHSHFEKCDRALRIYCFEQ